MENRFDASRFLTEDDKKFFNGLGEEAEKVLKSDQEKESEMMADFLSFDYPRRLLMMEECESALYDPETSEKERKILSSFVAWAKPQMPGESREI